MIKLRPALIVLFVISILTFSACNNEPANPDIRGAVTSITTIENGISILVEGEVEEDTTVDKASVFVKNNVSVTDKDGKRLKVSDIKQGDIVEVVFEGPVRDSYPVQADAKSVKIIQAAVQDAVLFSE